MSFASLIHRPRPNAWDRNPLWRDMDRFFDGLVASNAAPGVAHRVSAFVPKIEVESDEGGYTVTAELPGFEPDEFEVVVEDGRLTLKGAKRIEVEASSEATPQAEAEGAEAKAPETRTVKEFERRFRLGKGVDTENVNAIYRNGLLTVTLPRVAPETTTRSIPVTTA